jgi:hypothetical protein
VTPVERAIRNLAFLPLISDMQISASDLIQPTASDVESAIQSFIRERGAAKDPGQQRPQDPVIDTLQPQMIWQYAAHDYPVAPEWHDVFGWMNPSLPSQNAQL